VVSWAQGSEFASSPVLFILKMAVSLAVVELGDDRKGTALRRDGLG
jgi:hypothetical protein